jgi:hypothetical protein
MSEHLDHPKVFTCLLATKHLADGLDPWKLLRAFPQPDAIYSYAWYPSASVNQPATFCFLVAVRDGPLRLVDAADGRVRLSTAASQGDECS